MARSSNQARRRYDNRLREEQAEATRERILEAMLELFAAGDVADFSIGRVAKMAGVSEPTIYRHFKSRDGLIDAFGPWMEHRYDHPGFPDTLDGLVDAIPRVLEYFEANADLVRASLTYDDSELVGRDRRKRRRRVQQMLEPLTRHRPEPEAKALRAVLSEIVTGRNYFTLRDQYGLSPEAAGTAIQWTLRTLFDALRREQAQ